MLKSMFNVMFLFLITASALAQSGREKALAFPGADGFGKYATGGRGGRAIEVTNLNDDGAGSFRRAVTAKGARIVIFKVSGTIQLKKALTISYPNLTVAGQSAPEEGICIAGAPVYLKANNLIIRFLRFRMGDARGVNASSLTTIGFSNIIIDHCSISWATDANAKMYNNSAFTLQWSIISESFYSPKSSKTTKGYGAVLGGMNASFLHNLFAHNAQFNPNFGGAGYHSSTRSKEVVDFRNNVVYNWGTSSSSGGEGGNINIVGNYYKPGPATPKNKKTTILTVKNGGKFFLKDNLVYSNDSVSKDNWKGVSVSNVALSNVEADEEFPFVMNNTKSAEDAYIDVIAKSGASYKRDDVDSRIVQGTGTGSVTHGGKYGDKMGIIDSQQTVDNWPALKAGTPHQDTDGDGIPDAWEKNKGLNPNDASDARKKTLDKYYDNIEVFLNDLVKDVIK